MITAFKIKKPPHFDFAECLWFLDRNLDDCMHAVLADRVRKAIDLGGEKILFEISEQKKNLVVSILKGKLNEPDSLTAFINEWFDLDRDIEPFYRLLNKDIEFSVLAKNFKGLRIIGIPDFFEVLVWCVIGQQINLQFAYKVKRRFVEQYGSFIKFENEKYYLFPDPKVISELTIPELRNLQLTTRKAEYILGISRMFIRGELSKEKISQLKDEKQMLLALMKIRGIGEWTANYTIMKGFRAMNGVPYGDSGVNQALFNFKNIPKKNNREAVDKVFDKFEAWKTYLVFYLWRSLRNQKN